jgi:hypothetical protein
MMETENRPYWIIDILPKQVPADSPGRYFTVEKYFLAHLDELCRKFARVLIKLNCYRALRVSMDNEQWTEDFSPEDLETFFQDSVDTHTPLFIRILPSEALLAFTGDDHYLTLYAPDEDLLTLLRPLTASEGLFVWTPEAS